MSDTSEIERLNTNHRIGDTARFEAGEGGLPKLVIRTKVAEAEMYVHGAHVTHFQAAGHQPLLFMSRCSAFARDQPIRGGIPICFPWFGPHATDPDLPAHGFARTRAWRVHHVSLRDDHHVTVELTLAHDDKTRSLWPHEFSAAMTLGVDEDLSITLTVENQDNSELTYEAALHTYLQVGNAANVHVTGLENTEYIDKLEGGARKTQGNEPIRFTGETDRPYLHTAASCILHDPDLQRRITVSKRGSLSTVVWNPWTDKAARMPDFGDDEWPHMVCIETANVADNAVTLEPGASHATAATVSVERDDESSD